MATIEGLPFLGGEGGIWLKTTGLHDCKLALIQGLALFTGIQGINNCNDDI